MLYSLLAVLSCPIKYSLSKGVSIRIVSPKGSNLNSVSKKRKLWGFMRNMGKSA